MSQAELDQFVQGTIDQAATWPVGRGGWRVKGRLSPTWKKFLEERVARTGGRPEGVPVDDDYLRDAVVSTLKPEDWTPKYLRNWLLRNGDPVARLAVATNVSVSDAWWALQQAFRSLRGSYETGHYWDDLGAQIASYEKGRLVNALERVLPVVVRDLEASHHRPAGQAPEAAQAKATEATEATEAVAVEVQG